MLDIGWWMQSGGCRLLVESFRLGRCTLGVVFPAVGSDSCFFRFFPDTAYSLLRTAVF